MTQDDFQSMSYQEQWYYLVDWITHKYRDDQYLYYALYTLIDAYKRNLSFNFILNDLHYKFD